MTCTTGAYVECNTQNHKRGITRRTVTPVEELTAASLERHTTVPGCGGSLAAIGVTVLRQLQRRRQVLEGR